MPQISIIVPVYNCEEFLKDSVSSLLNQTFSDFEVILIDDGSTDNSPAICDKLAQKDNRVKVFHTENGGPSRARNIGLDNALGDYIYFADSDDSVEAECLQTALKYLNEKGFEIVSFGITHIRNDGSDVITYKYTELKSNDELKKALPTYFKYCDVNPLCNKMFNADIIRKNNIRFLEGTVVEEDLMFNLEVFKHTNSMVIIPEAFYNYNCRTEGSVTTKYNPNKFVCIKKAYTNELTLFNEWGVNTLDQMLHNKYLTHLSATINNLMYKDCDMTKAQKIGSIKEYLTDEVSLSCCEKCIPDNKRNKMIMFFIKHNMAKTAYNIHHLVFKLKGR